MSATYWVALPRVALGKEAPRPVPLVPRVRNRWHRLLSVSYFIFPSGTVWLSAKSLPSARVLTLGKFLFAGEEYTGWPLPSTALDKGFPGGFGPFAECLWHSAYNSIPVVPRR